MKFTLASIFALTTGVAISLAFRQFLPAVFVAACVAAASLACAGGLVAFIVGIPVFFQVGFVLLFPLVLAVARETRTPLLLVGLPLLAGLSTVHALVPPHPAAMLAVTTFGADVGTTILLALLVGLPAAALAGPVYARWLAPRLALPDESPMSAQFAEQMLSVTDQSTRSGIWQGAAARDVVEVAVRSIFDVVLGKRELVRAFLAAATTDPEYAADLKRIGSHMAARIVTVFAECNNVPARPSRAVAFSLLTAVALAHHTILVGDEWSGVSFTKEQLVEETTRAIGAYLGLQPTIAIKREGPDTAPTTAVRAVDPELDGDTREVDAPTTEVEVPASLRSV